MPLTDVKARTAKSGEKAYKLADGKGLFMLVQPNGSKYWRLKYRHAGKEKQLALGVYPEVTLAQARELTLEARVLLKAGNDPGTERKATKARAVESAAVTFEGVAREWMENRGDTWAPSYAEKVGAILGNNLFPRIGALPITSITAPMLLGALRPIEARGALEVAARAGRWAGEVFRYAIATGRATEDPAGVLKGALKVGQTKHYPALRREEVGAFLRALLEYPGRPEARLALQILLLTLVRPGELRAACWTEFDLEGAEWRVPRERMKARVEHIVPLSLQTVALLKELQSLTGHAACLFPTGHARDIAGSSHSPPSSCTKLPCPAFPLGSNLVVVSLSSPRQCSHCHGLNLILIDCRNRHADASPAAGIGPIAGDHASPCARHRGPRSQERIAVRYALCVHHQCKIEGA